MKTTSHAVRIGAFVCLLVFASSRVHSPLSAASVPGESGEMELRERFLNPPNSAKPGVLWMWMGCNLSEKGITRDLEALKEAGFGRTTMFSLADVTTPWAGEIRNSPTPEIISWTEPWWKLVRHAARESKRLGLDFGMFNGPSYESSGGPWITPELSMQEICWSRTLLTGGAGEKEIPLDRPKVDPRAVQPFPVFNPETGLVEKPEIPARKTYYRDITVLAMPADGVVTRENVVDLSGKLSADGTLRWAAPAGSWAVYRFGHTTMGTLIQPAQWKATGLECDKMSAEAVTFHMNHVIGEIQKHLGDLIGTGFTHVHFDSYEAGTPSWTPRMREEFKARRGYDLTPFLPVFAGRTVASGQESARFKSDFDATIQDLHRDVYFATIARMLHDAKLEFLCEPYGGPWRHADVMPKVDRVMTEFWTGGGRFQPYELEPTVAALRKSGQNLVEAEAFTGQPGDSQWQETPAWLKPIGDAAFCAGVNRLVLHRFVQQPWDSRYLPGATMGQWGTHFDRTQTWWRQARALVQYWHRCQSMLLWGRFVGGPDDFAAYKPQGRIALKAIHRGSSEADVFFVANTERSSGSAWCGFAVTGRIPELWDPVTGTMRELTQFEQRDGKTLVPIDFAPAQSFFVVFKEPLAAARKANDRGNFPAVRALYDVGGGWEVLFDSKWGGPSKAVLFEQLTDWTQHTNPGIRYYSGTALYRKAFDLPMASRELPSSVQLDLGAVKHVARVRLNGRDLGVVWTAPWKVAVPSGLLRSQGNQLVVEVVNVWANRLIGDEQEPADCEWAPGHMGGWFLKQFPEWFLKGRQRPSRGRFCFTTWNYFTKDSPLVSSGLLGPVRLVTEDWATSVKPALPAGVDVFSNESLISEDNAAIVISARTDAGSMAALESDLAKTNLLAATSGTKVERETFAHDGGGSDVGAVLNGTTRNGSGGGETQNDGLTFRGYAQGNSITFRLDASHARAGYDLEQVRTFAGHGDGRASQAYSVWVAFAKSPTEFVRLAGASFSCDGGASELRMTARANDILDNGSGVRATGVVAVRFDFESGPLGFNVYRELQVVGRPTTQ